MPETTASIIPSLGGKVGLLPKEAVIYSAGSEDAAVFFGQCHQ